MEMCCNQFMIQDLSIQIGEKNLKKQEERISINLIFPYQEEMIN